MGDREAGAGPRAAAHAGAHAARRPPCLRQLLGGRSPGLGWAALWGRGLSGPRGGGVACCRAVVSQRSRRAAPAPPRSLKRLQAFFTFISHHHHPLSPDTSYKRSPATSTHTIQAI